MRCRGAGLMGRATAVAVLAIVAAGLAGCGGGGDQARAPHPPADLAQYFVEPVGVPPDQLPDPKSVGAKLAGEFCSQCHGIPAPSSHSASDWTPILRNMFLRMDRMARMGMMGGMMMGAPTRGMRTVVAPSAEEERDLAGYYQKHALHALPPGATPAEGPGRELFARTCSRCHALPDPAKYSAAQWPAVVARMRENMTRMHVSGITDQQTQEVVAYLEKASSTTATPTPDGAPGASAGGPS